MPGNLIKCKSCGSLFESRWTACPMCKTDVSGEDAFELVDMETCPKCDLLSPLDYCVRCKIPRSMFIKQRMKRCRFCGSYLSLSCKICPTCHSSSRRASFLFDA